MLIVWSFNDKLRLKIAASKALRHELAAAVHPLKITDRV